MLNRFWCWAPGAVSSTRRIMTMVFSVSLLAVTVSSLITIVSISGLQRNNFERQTVARRAQDIARLLETSPARDAPSILANAAEPGVTITLERPSPERRRYLETTIAQYIRPPDGVKLGDTSRDPPDLAGQQYFPQGNPLLAAREALGLSPRRLAYVMEGQGEDYWRVSLPVNDGQWLTLETRPTGAIREGVPRLEILFIAMTVLIAIGSLIALRRLTDPLQALENAAIRLGRDLEAAPLPEDGPRDIRRVAQAFNRMQDQLRRFVNDRTTMLAAISHDLRTPLQRLKFRAEFVSDVEEREKMLRDLSDMEAMIAATLDFARGDAAVEAAASIDLVEMLADVARELTEAGYDVALDTTPPRLIYRCRAGALKRAVVNLAVNAATYGRAARLSLESLPSSARITVTDAGPGLPDDELDKVFAPFYRVETSRTPGAGGTGLGLPIARTIARGHGGDIILSNRPGGGLRADLTLPC